MSGDEFVRGWRHFGASPYPVVDGTSPCSLTLYSLSSKN
jgi:hypothetical protein